MTREHGTRSKYVQDKCRCDECRAANREYQRDLNRRRRVTPSMVGSARARRHLLELRQQGIGNKTVALTIGMSTRTVQEIASGESSHIRPDTEQRILSVSAANVVTSGYVEAGPTWAIIDKLLAAGWTKSGISAAIGGNGRALQLSRTRIRAGRARAIAELWEQEQATNPDDRPVRLPNRAAYDLPEFWEGDIDWMKRGACRSKEVPTWLFFAGRGDLRTTEAAKAVCANCSVTQPCLDYALRNRAAGVWGGTSGAERRGMKPSEAAKFMEQAS